MELKIVENLSDQDFDYLFNWDESIFPIEGQGINWAKPKHRIIAFENDLPIAHIGFAPFQLILDSEQVIEVVGVGGVLVRPEHQGKNIPNKLFTLLHSCQEAIAISTVFTLFCPERLVKYYQRHGYKRYKGNYTFMQNKETTGTDKFIFMYQGLDINAQDIHINGNPW